MTRKNVIVAAMLTGVLLGAGNDAEAALYDFHSACRPAAVAQARSMAKKASDELPDLEVAVWVSMSKAHKTALDLLVKSPDQAQAIMRKLGAERDYDKWKMREAMAQLNASLRDLEESVMKSAAPRAADDVEHLNIATYALQINVQLVADVVEYEAANKVTKEFEFAKKTLLTSVPNLLGAFIRCKADLIALRSK